MERMEKQHTFAKILKQHGAAPPIQGINTVRAQRLDPALATFKGAVRAQSHGTRIG
jgi:hypothetical protein